MKEILARVLIAVVGFLVGYLLMAFVVNTFDATQWDIEQRGSLAMVEGILILLISTFPIKITK